MKQGSPNIEPGAESTAESESLGSQGITFRDPETGVLYVQMQLLQVCSLPTCYFSLFKVI